MSNKIPSVQILNTIRPDNAGTGEPILLYESLPELVEGYDKTSSARFRTFLDAEEGSFVENIRAKQVASEFLTKVAKKAIEAPEYDGANLWAGRYTEASSELYGAPNKVVAEKLIQDEYNFFKSLDGDRNVSPEQLNVLLAAYEPLVQSSSTSKGCENQPDDKEKMAMQAFGGALIDAYGPIFEAVGDDANRTILPGDFITLFKSAKNWLAEEHSATWKDWKVVETGGNSLSMSSASNEIRVPKNRQSSSAAETRGLLGHELLAHGVRPQNGYLTGFEEFGKGLAGWTDTEEGLGVAIEYALTGNLPDKITSRYIDIALAMGTVDGKQKTRSELFKISFARKYVQTQLEGTVIDAAAIQDMTLGMWGHIDRIYRGGRGDTFTPNQAIFTKDIIYFTGYTDIAGFIVKQIDNGRSARDVMEFLLSGRFNPIDPKHIDWIESNVDSKVRQKFVF